jgi:uncharacterized RDD family membrane protein YckC
MEINSQNNFPRATPGHRIAAVAVDAGLYIVTLGIGWAIWNLVMWSKGQTPGKNLLKIRVLNESNGRPASWGQMCIRQALIGAATSFAWYLSYMVLIVRQPADGARIAITVVLVISSLITIAVGILDFVWLFGPKNKRLIDYWVKTYVVNEAPNLKTMYFPQPN